MDIKYKIQNIIHWLRYDLPKGISNLIKYFNIIWKDRNYDFVYLYAYLKRKLELDYKFYSEKGHLESNTITAKNLKLTISLCEKCETEYYDCEPLDLNDEEYLIKYKGKQKRLLNRKLEGFKNLNLDYSKMSKRTQVMYISTYNNSQCKRLLFKLMENKIDSWWD